jgi:hypothetical protein
MRSWLSPAAAATVLLALLAAASGPPVESTAVEGDVPTDLAGRWLVVEQNRLRTGIVQPFARLWEIRGGGNGVELVLARVRLPESIAEKLTAAGAASRVWAPDDEDLRRIAERWDGLPRSVSDFERVEHRLTAGALEIVTEERFSGTRPLQKTRSVYTVRERDARRLVGSFTRVSEVTTPAPVSIALDGEFQAYRLPVVAPRSRLRRLLDAWLGRDEPS